MEVSWMIRAWLSRASEHQRSGRAFSDIQRLPGPTVSTRGLHEASQRLSSTTPTTSSMGLCISTTSRLRSTKRIDQGAISVRFQSAEGVDHGVLGGESQRQRYACSPVTLIGLRVNIAQGQQPTYYINPHPR